MSPRRRPSAGEEVIREFVDRRVLLEHQRDAA